MSMKLILAATALAAVSATAATAQSSFPVGTKLNPGTVLEIGTVRAEGPGVLEIYDFRKGEQGDLLGAVPLNEGANANVRVSVPAEPRFGVLSVIRVNGEIVATKSFAPARM